MLVVIASPVQISGRVCWFDEQLRFDDPARYVNQDVQKFNLLVAGTSFYDFIPKRDDINFPKPKTWV